MPTDGHRSDGVERASEDVKSGSSGESPEDEAAACPTNLRGEENELVEEGPKLTLGRDLHGGKGTPGAGLGQGEPRLGGEGERARRVPRRS